MILSETQIVELSERIARRLASLEDEIACRLGEKGAPLPRLGEAVRTARQTAQAEPGPGALAAVIARLRTQAPGGGAMMAAGE